MKKIGKSGRLGQSGRYKLALVVVFLIIWAWAAYRPSDPHDWFLENLLVFIFIPIIILTGKWFKLSNLSYTFIAVYMILHVIGSHYTYGEVPFGYTLQGWFEPFGSMRNMYDRLVHFSFGLLLAYPIREIFMRLARTKGLWSYFFPIDITFALSALYEIMEWITAINVNPEAGLAFLGSQGDIWDSQKDMFLAGIGASLAMLVVFIVNARFQKNFREELRESLAVGKADGPLGEEKLMEYLEK